MRHPRARSLSHLTVTSNSNSAAMAAAPAADPPHHVQAFLQRPELRVIVHTMEVIVAGRWQSRVSAICMQCSLDCLVSVRQLVR